MAGLENVKFSFGGGEGGSSYKLGEGEVAQPNVIGNFNQDIETSKAELFAITDVDYINYYNSDSYKVVRVEGFYQDEKGHTVNLGIIYHRFQEDGVFAWEEIQRQSSGSQIPPTSGKVGKVLFATGETGEYEWRNQSVHSEANSSAITAQSESSESALNIIPSAFVKSVDNGGYAVLELDSAEIKSQIDSKFDKTSINAYSTTAVSNAHVEAEFDKSVTPNSSSSIELVDSEHSDGYGKFSESTGKDEITYFNISNNGTTPIAPNTEYGTSFFVPEVAGKTIGYFLLHESMFNVASSVSQIPMTFIGATGAISKASSYASTGAIWHVTGYQIPSSDDANAANPAQYMLKDGTVQSELPPESESARYTSGPMRIIGEQVVKRGYTTSSGDSEETLFHDDSSSEFFVGYGTLGSGALPQKRLHQLLITDVTKCRAYLADDAPTSLGFQVSANSESLKDTYSYVEIASDEADENGLFEIARLHRNLAIVDYFNANETKTISLGYRASSVSVVSIQARAVTSTGTTNLFGKAVQHDEEWSLVMTDRLGEDLGLTRSIIVDDDGFLAVTISASDTPFELTLTSGAKG